MRRIWIERRNGKENGKRREKRNGKGREIKGKRGKESGGERGRGGMRFIGMIINVKVVNVMMRGIMNMILGEG